MQNMPGQARPEDYQQLLDEKVALTKQEFAAFDVPDVEVFPSPASHFRMRAEFKIWHEDNTAHYAMYEQGKYKTPVLINEFTIGSATINSLMPALLNEINRSICLRRKLFQAEFLTTTTQESLITLIYHRPLDDQWMTEAKELAEKLNCKIIGRSRGQKSVLSDDYVTETFELNNGTYHYQQVESSFTQPNGFVCQDMLNWAVDSTKDLSGDLLELYCGNGNFTLPLSKNFNKVLATEVSKTSTNSAIHNIERNGISNIFLARLSAEEISSAINGEREFRRLKDLPLDTFSFSTVFVDPPRAGLDDATEKMVSQYDNIIYVSCNPETLLKNLVHLTKSHKITRFALFDQFPYTHHRECGVILTRR